MKYKMYIDIQIENNLMTHVISVYSDQPKHSLIKVFTGCIHNAWTSKILLGKTVDPDQTGMCSLMWVYTDHVIRSFTVRRVSYLSPVSYFMREVH